MIEIDDRVMNKIISDVKEIIIEPDGTSRFVFAESCHEECDNAGEIRPLESRMLAGVSQLVDIRNKRIVELEKIIKDKEELINQLKEEIDELNYGEKELEEKSDLYD